MTGGLDMIKSGKGKFAALFVGLLGLGAIALAPGACDSVDAAFDCQAVCSKYKDCYNKDYDVGKCRDSCRAGADADDVKRRKADACEACISGMSCVGATFNCAQDCGGIVP
jgi:hypothetical protein